MENVLSKDDFCNAIAAIQSFWDKIREIENVLGVVFDEDSIVNIVSSYIDTLSFIMGDYSNEDSWINYFCWELDFGRNWEPGCVEIDGKDYPLSNAGELYELLVREYE